MVKYQQTFTNSCGAATLLCAALELNVLTIPQSNIHPLWIGAHNIVQPNGDQQSEIMLYAVTSGATGAPNNNSGYSLPSRIAAAARELGLTTIAYVPQSILGGLLLFLYGNEQIDAQNAGMLLKREAAPTLLGTQRLLKVLRVGDASSWLPATGLHYVMQRPDLSIMDPAVGQNFPDLDLCIQSHQANGTFYQDTGVAILIA